MKRAKLQTVALGLALSVCLLGAIIDPPTLFYQALKLKIQLDLGALTILRDISALAVVALCGCLRGHRSRIGFLVAAVVAVMGIGLHSGAGKDLEFWPLSVSSLVAACGDSLLPVTIYLAAGMATSHGLSWAGRALINNAQTSKNQTP